MRNIKKSVRKFLAEYNLCNVPLSSETLNEIIRKQGFEIVFFDTLNMTGQAQRLADQLNLHSKCQNSSGFTYCKGDVKLLKSEN